MKSSKAQIEVKFHKIPVIQFEDQKLSSFSGLLIFQALFKKINLKRRLKYCFSHLKVSPIFGRHLIVMLLVVHLILGFRRLREIDYYRDDPLVLRLMGLRRLPDVSTVSRALSEMSTREVDKVRNLSRTLVIEGLSREKLSRLTLDFDGSVQSTKGHAEGTAVGFNKQKKERPKITCPICGAIMRIIKTRIQMPGNGEAICLSPSGNVSSRIP